MTRRILRTFSLAVLAVALGSLGAGAQSPGETIDGVVAAISGTTLSVARAGREVSVRVGAQTRVVVSPRSGGRFPDASIGFLRPGMGVRYTHSDGVVDRILVTSVPEGAWPGAPTHRRGRHRGLAREGVVGREVSARLVSVDPRAGEVEADVDGRRERYRVERAGSLRWYAPGDAVVLTIDDSGTAVDVRDRGLRGRVTGVDAADGVVRLQMGGREETFGVSASVLGDLRVGDRVRLEFEERSGGGRVITAWRRR